MEAKGEFNIKGVLNLATITGLIKFVDGKLKNGRQYVRWVDVKTEDPVPDTTLAISLTLKGYFEINNPDEAL
ncbi:hypothetical protein BY996DRAFT_7126543 [Phakopsora pachyrhizi]|nr:hypothetical protein BY996DRAFT_7126543 [Phakopsora pachyrhizi]